MGHIWKEQDGRKAEGTPSPEGAAGVAVWWWATEATG